MALVIFDIDGTLTQTKGVDDSLFVRAFDEALGVRGFDPNWANYPHATDSSLVVEIVSRARQDEQGRPAPPTPEEIALVQEAYFASLRAQAKVKGRIKATPGAAQLIEEIRKRRSWHVAIATGGWRESAMIKLNAAGLFTFGIPSAFADDALSRSAIVMKAMILASGFNFARDERAEALAVIGERYGGIVYVGDGVWDVRTARELGIGFLGIRPAGEEKPLRVEGARTIVRDFKKTGEMLELLEIEAGAPPWR